MMTEGYDMQAITTEADEMLSIAHLMRLTGESESCWRKRLGRREIEFIRLGTNVRVRRSALERWLTERTVPRRERA